MDVRVQTSSKESQKGKVITPVLSGVLEAALHAGWERLFDQSAVGVMQAGPDLHLTRVNRRVADMLGYAPDELASMTVIDVTYPDDRAHCAELVGALSREHPVDHVEKRYLHKNGSPVWVSLAVSALYGTDGSVQSYFAVMEDIGERKSQAEMLASEKHILEQIASGVELGRVLEEIASLWEQRSRRYPHCAVTLSSAGGERVWVAAAPGLPPAFKGMMWSPAGGASLFTSSRETVVQDLEIDPGALPEKGILRALGVRACWRRPVVGAKGHVIGALMACAPQAALPDEADYALMERLLQLSRIAIEKSQVEHEVVHLSSFDSLTGLPIRSVLLDRLDKALAQGARRGSRTALVLLNLDGMSSINESLGYAFGDEFIRDVARRLRSHLRHDETLARFSGDEFAVVIEGAPDDAAMDAIAQGLLECVTRPTQVAGEELFATASLGLGVAESGQAGGEDLFRYADAALHRAKAQGGNSFRRYTPDMDTSAGRLKLLSELRHALERGEFRVYYQPQQNLADGSVAGVEALMRWEHPRRGLVPPGEFIPLLEETGLILAAGEWLVRQACRDMAQLAAEGLAPPRVAVNLSARQFHQPDLAERIAAILKETGLGGERLGVEITESLMMQEPELTARTLHRLKALSVNVSVDDFGIAYSSFAYLKRFPIDVLKLDKSFVDGVAEQGADAAIAETIIRLAHKLGMKTVAEGVETQAQRDFLRDQCCDELQGYLYSEPVDLGRFSAFLMGSHAAAAAKPEAGSAIIACKR